MRRASRRSTHCLVAVVHTSRRGSPPQVGSSEKRKITFAPSAPPRRLPVGGPPRRVRRAGRLEPRAARAACEALAAPRPSPQEREARLGPRRCPRQPPREGAPAQSHPLPLRAVRLGQRRKRALARICPYRWAHGGKERWAPAREGRGTCAELALRDAARAWACTQGVTRKQEQTTGKFTAELTQRTPFSPISSDGQPFCRLLVVQP